MSFQDKKVALQGFQLGVREKTSDYWSYIDGEKLTPDILNKFFEDFPKDIRLPEIKTSFIE
jgi:hypothetical protein